MSSLKIEERITVSAPPPRVWAFLLDPAKVAACLPGARLDGSEGERTFVGTMKVKVGPVTMEFKGKATLTEVDEAERRVTMVGTGNDKSGSGSARMEMKSSVVADGAGGSEIVVVADVDVAGKLVRFGRGMMEGVSKQLFKQFAERVRAELATGAEEEAPGEEAPEERAAAAEPPEAPKAEEPRAEAAPAAAEVEAAPKAEEAPEAEEAPKVEAAPKVEEAPKAEAAPKAEEPTQAAEPEASEPKVAAKAPLARVEKRSAEPEALDAGSLFWTVVWEWLKGLFRRIFGRRG